MTQTKTVALTVPLTSGSTEITALTLRRPTAGDLRGIKLQGLSEMDVTTVLLLLPRLLVEPLSPQALDAIDPVDLLALTAGVSDFFTTIPAPSPTTP